MTNTTTTTNTNNTANREECVKMKQQQPDAKEAKLFYRKILERTDHKRSRMDKENEKIVTRIRIRPIGENTPLITQSNSKKYLLGFWFKKFSFIHGRVAIERNRW